MENMLGNTLGTHRECQGNTVGTHWEPGKIEKKNPTMGVSHWTPQVVLV
jgi:hypothetical protein